MPVPYVLLVDEDPDALDRLREWVGPGYRVLAAPTTEQARKMLRASTVSVVVAPFSGSDAFVSDSRSHSAASLVLTAEDRELEDVMTVRRTVSHGRIFALLKEPLDRDDLLHTVSDAARDYYERVKGGFGCYHVSVDADVECPVLLLDDDEDEWLLVRRAWEEVGVPNPLLVFRTEEDLLEHLGDTENGRTPALLLLDVHLGVSDGLDVLRQLKSDPRFAEIPVVIYTTHAGPREMNEAYSAGAGGAISKPASYASLIRMVENVGRYWLQTVVVNGKARTGLRAAEGTAA